MLKPPPSYLLRETTQVVWRIARHLRVTWMNRWKIRSLNDSLNENCGPVCKWTHATTKFQRRWWKICAWNMYIYIYDHIISTYILGYDMPFTTLQALYSSRKLLTILLPQAQQPLGLPKPPQGNNGANVAVFDLPPPQRREGQRTFTRLTWNIF